MTDLIDTGLVGVVSNTKVTASADTGSSRIGKDGSVYGNLCDAIIKMLQTFILVAEVLAHNVRHCSLSMKTSLVALIKGGFNAYPS